MAILNAEAPVFMPTSIVNNTTTTALVPYYNNNNTNTNTYQTTTYQSLVLYPFYNYPHYPTYSGNFSSRFYPLLQTTQNCPSQLVTYCTSDAMCVPSSQWQLINPSSVVHDQEAQVVDKEVVSVKVVSRPSRPSRPSRVVKGERFKEISIGGGCGERSVIWKAKGLKVPEKVKALFERSVKRTSGVGSVGIQSDGTSTTVMIRNIPNKYTREMLLDLLDKHCEEENKRVQMEHCDGINGNSSLSAYDFVYLPIDFGTKCNKGYAFVNFTNPNAAYKLFVSFQHRRWNVLNSRKICEITCARIQGKDALVKHFQKSMFECEEDEFLPICFDPHCDGSLNSREIAETKVVGRRLLGTQCASTSTTQIKQ